jgi:phenylalanyl-tRNA synthetase beta chain
MFDVKADAEAVLAAMGAPAKVQILRGGPDWWHPGRHGMICLGPKKVLGIFGELHPRFSRRDGRQGPGYGLHPVPGRSAYAARHLRQPGRVTMPEFQAVDRDFAFVVDADVEAGALVNAAQGADKALIAGVRVFDEFIGGSLGEGKKSIALSVHLQPTERTLTEDEIEAVAAKVVEKVTKATGGVLRG